MLSFVLWQKYYPETFSENIEFEKLNSRKIFENIYWDMLNNRKWKDREYHEKTIIYNNYIVLKIEDIIVWWYGLIEREINWTKWKIIECLFSKRTWIWDIILNLITGEEEVLFAYSKENDFFVRNWFIKVDWEKSPTWANLYVHELKYPI